MNCVNCGKSLRAGAMFCPQCGTEQPDQQPADAQPEEYPPTDVIPAREPAPYPSYQSAPEDPEPTYPGYDAAPEAGAKPRWPLIVGIIVAVLCVLCICVTAVGIAISQGMIEIPF